MRNRGQDCHSDTGEMGVLAAERKAADCSTSAFLQRNRRLIAVPWATGLQLSPDRIGYLVQHANKTAVASPTANHWLSACCRLLQLSPALFYSVAVPGNELLHFSNFTKGGTFSQPHLKQMCAFEGRISRHLATTRGLSESSVV